MEQVRLGKSGLKISQLVLGCMTYGVPDRGLHNWTLDETEAAPLIRQAYDLGITTFDTANSYSDGTSEEIVGRVLKGLAPRASLVLTTKVFYPTRKGPDDGGGLSRKAIFAEIDNSLRRLQTDYVDLYQVHRWDSETPIEETMEALHDVVKAGKARYIGASSMYAWQFAKSLHVARRNGWTPFVSMQDHLNLLYREEEREMLPLCQDAGIGVMAWSPMARGRLARASDESSARQKSDAYGDNLYAATEDADRRIIDAVGRVAKSRGVSRAQVALAWVARHAGVTAPIVGASKPRHLDDAVGALSVELTADETRALEEAYVPHAVVGLD